MAFVIFVLVFVFSGCKIVSVLVEYREGGKANGLAG